MHAHDLARLLLEGPNLPVRFAYPSGDYWNTIKAGEVKRVEVGETVWSMYHNMNVVAFADDDDDVEKTNVILIG